MGRVRDLDVRTIRIGIAGLVVLAIVVFLLVKAFGGSGDDNSGTNGAVALTQGELIDRAASVGHVVYWVGPQPDTDSYEFTATPDGRFYVRYLTGGARAGDPAPNYLSVGTYVIPNAVRALDQGAAQQNSTITEKPGYDLLEGPRNNAYVVFQDEPDLQIEVYSPKPGEAMRLASSGALRQIGR